MKKINMGTNLSKEKLIITSVLSLSLAVLFDGKHKKPEKRKSFIQRFNGFYHNIDRIFFLTAAKAVSEKQNTYKTKLKNLEIQNSEIIDI